MQAAFQCSTCKTLIISVFFFTTLNIRRYAKFCYLFYHKKFMNLKLKKSLYCEIFYVKNLKNGMNVNLSNPFYQLMIIFQCNGTKPFAKSISTTQVSSAWILRNV